jgi:hypothetical protein
MTATRNEWRSFQTESMEAVNLQSSELDIP